jgi:hypothetical protein
MIIINRNLRTVFQDMGRALPPEEGNIQPLNVLADTLKQMAASVAPQPLVILFDEVDVLEGDPLIRFLRLLRGGFASRGPGKFPTSLALVGMRDLKDYITASKDGVAPNPGSPFNIKQDSASLGNFSENDIARLFAQRTAETGQQITPEALDYVWDQSRGQPWIVNSLFMRATLRVLDEGSTETVTLAHVTEAREQMVQARETHLDALGKRLEDPRVKKVIQTILIGGDEPLSRMADDVQYVMDLGLVRWDSETLFTISNPVYSEILTRYLNAAWHDSSPPIPVARWQRPDGGLDMDKLLAEFQKFWRRHAEIWEATANYTEAFPHLLLMAFLQRLTNGGGRIERECASGRGRMDLLVEYKNESNIIEIKLLRDRDTPAAVLEEGLGQIVEYRDQVGGNLPSYLLIFDRRSEGKKLPWDQRLWRKTLNTITILGC